jgi:hypothetical protein
VALATAATLAAPPASAELPPQLVEDSAPAPEELTFVSTATAELLNGNMTKVLESREYGPGAMEQIIAPLNADNAPGKPLGDVTTSSWEEGFGGSSSASGCQRVTVHNTGHNALGSVAYKFHTWTDWCWNRANETVSSVLTGWYITDVDSTYDWKGIINSDLRFFAWQDGAPHSGYIHMRQGKFDNCIVKYGCVGTSYPANRLRSRSNGTWYWATDGAV